jgi:hypothetical protein
MILGTDLATPVGAPWAKAGTVADRILFLGNEDSNNWSGWFNASEGLVTNAVASASGGYLEGTVRLEAYIGAPLPEGIYLAAGAYTSPDGGTLQGQAPAGNGNGSIDAAEYAYFPLPTSAVPHRPSWPGWPGETSGPSLVSVFPNPCDGRAGISFVMPWAGEVRVSVFDIRGRSIATLAEGPRAAGRHSIIWYGLDSNGRVVPAGIYSIRLEARGNPRVPAISAPARKIVLVR